MAQFTDLLKKIVNVQPREILDIVFKTDFLKIILVVDRILKNAKRF